MTSSRVACLLITITCLLVNPAKAFPIPHSVKHTSFVSSSHVELAVLSIFTIGKRSPTIPYMASVSSCIPPPSPFSGSYYRFDSLGIFPVGHD